MVDVNHPRTNYPRRGGGVCSDLGQPSREIYEPNQKLLRAPPNFKKIHCLCILECHLSVNPILSALHLQGLKSNIPTTR